MSHHGSRPGSHRGNPGSHRGQTPHSLARTPQPPDRRDYERIPLVDTHEHKDSRQQHHRPHAAQIAASSPVSPGEPPAKAPTHGSSNGGHMEEEEEEEDGPGEDVALPEDIYGAAIFSAIHDSVEVSTQIDQDNLSRWVNALRMSFVAASLVITYTLQLGVLGWSYRIIVAPAIGAAQQLYAEYHAQCFETDGVFSEPKWEEWGRQKQQQLCDMVLSSFWLLYLLLCFWWMVALSELRKASRLRATITDIPCAVHLEEQAEHVLSQGKIRRVKRLAPQVKWLLIFCMILPKYVVLTIVLMVGTWWLAACCNPGDLLLAVLALGFVVKLDDLVFEAMYPFRLRREIWETKVWRRRAAHGSAVQREQWSAYLWCSILWGAVLVGPYVYLCFVQDLPWLGVVPGFAGDAACGGHWIKQTDVLCSGWAVWKGANCFPYGAVTEVLPPHPEVYG